MTYLDYINANYPIRNTNEQKYAFRRYVVECIKEKGSVVEVEETKDGKNKNIVIGNPSTAKVILTAHYDTPWASWFPNIMIPKNLIVFYAYQFLPVILMLSISLALAYLIGFVIMNDRNAYILSFLILYYGLFFLSFRGFKNKNNHNDNTSGVATVLEIMSQIGVKEKENVAVILFDNEEKGKKGSAAYYKDHKEIMDDKFLINFDCVGNGNNIIFIAQPKAVDSKEYSLLKSAFDLSDDFNLDFSTHKEGNSNSDHKNFPKGVACVACKKAKLGLLYTPRIHTSADVIANNVNIDFIAKNISSFISKFS